MEQHSEEEFRKPFFFCQDQYESNLALTFSQTTNLYSSQLREFADDNFKFDENDGKFSKRVETPWERRDCSL